MYILILNDFANHQNFFGLSELPLMIRDSLYPLGAATVIKDRFGYIIPEALLMIGDRFDYRRLLSSSILFTMTESFCDYLWGKSRSTWWTPFTI